MRSTNFTFPQTAFRAAIVSGMFLFASLMTFAPANAQTATATDHAPAPVSLRDSALARSRTPLEVVNGTAQLVGRYNSQSKLRLTLGLAPRKMAEQEQFLAELQDKKSPNFHKYLTPEQWNARFAPAIKDEQAVIDWANNAGLTVTKRYPNRLIVDVEGSSESVEKAFAIQINSYKVGASSEFSNDRDPVIPTQLSGVLQSVGGLNSIQRAHAPREGDIEQKSSAYSAGPVTLASQPVHANGNKTAFDAALKASELKLGSSQQLKSIAKDNGLTPGMTSGYIDPTDIYSSYGYDYGALQAQGHCCNPTHDSGGSTPTTSIAIATAGDFANSDLAGFQSRYNYLAYNVNRVWVDGTPSCCNDETTLDVEWAVATANSFGSYLDTSHVWVYEGANSYQSTFTDVYNAMLNDGHARIFSTSWGCAELSCTPSSTMDTDHNVFNAMLGQGWTILALSHDYGATGGCDDALRVSYPASDPDIIAVGGTSLALYSDGTFASETAWEGGTWSGACSKNDGGSGGGCSAYYAAPGYQSHPYCGAGSRSVPDIAVNAGYGQNYYFNGGFSGVGGTSISTPQVAGFMAQENAYLLSIGVGCGSGYGSACAPMGQADYPMYYEGYNPGYAPHNPYYDITVGCNNNDVTAYYGLGYYCAGTGYDAVTGWGSFNALQLSWAISTYYAGDFAAPTISFSGPPATSTAYTWYNTDQTVSWTVADSGNGTYPAVGVAGFSQAWDQYISDPTTEPNEGTGNSFYSGPQFPNATSGYLQLSWAGQGCHYASVDAWDNTGFTTGNQYYYWLCYDTVAPTATATSTPAANSNGWRKQTVSTTIATADPGGSQASGVTNTYYAVDTTACYSGNLGACANYGSAINIATQGYHYIAYFAKDKAGNFSPEGYDYVYIDETAPVTSASLSGTLSGSVYDSAVQVVLHATDNLSGVAATSYQLDGGAATHYTGAINVSTLGSHTVKFFSTDYAGNTEAAKSVSFSISASTSTVLTVSPNPGLNGETITLHAAISANLGATPTGTVTFKNGAIVLGTASVSADAASLNVTSLPFGSDVLTATYSGTTNILGSTSAGVTEVYKEKTTTTLTSTANPLVAGHAVTFEAKVVPSVSGTPAGSVQFYDGATLLSTVSLSGGTASYSSSALIAGTHPVHVVYGGSTTDSNSTSATLNEVVNKTATKTVMTTSVNPSQFLQAVTFTATVSSTSGIPTGTVTFERNGVSIGTGSLAGGVAHLTTTNMQVGTQTITAVYAATADYLASTSANLTETTHAAETKTQVTSSLNPSTHGQSVTFTAKVTPGTSGTPTGTVTFKDGTTVLGTQTLSGGSAKLALTTLASGTHSITVTYGGTTDYTTSTSAALSQVVH